MNAKLRRKLKQRKRKMLRRIDKGNWSGSSPMIRPPSIAYELAEKQQAIAAGGIGNIDDLRALDAAGIAGAVVGTALYTGAIDPGAVTRECPT